MNDLNFIVNSALEYAMKFHLTIAMIATLIVYFYNRNTTFFGVLTILEALVWLEIKDMQYTHMIAEILDKNEKLLLIRNALALFFLLLFLVFLLLWLFYIVKFANL